MAESLGTAVLELTTDSSGLDKGLDQAEAKSKSWVSSVGGALGTGLKVGIGVAVTGIAAVGAVLIDSTKAAMDAQEKEAQLDAVLKSTGDAAAENARKWADAQGEFVTVAAQSTAEQKKLTAENKKAGEEYGKLGDKLTHAKAKLADMEASWATSKKHTQSGALAIEDARKNVASLEAALAKGGPTLKGFETKTISLAKSLGLTAPVARMTKDGILDLADSLSKVTPVEDDAIVAGEAMLLTFTNIGKDVFPETTKTLLDMATAMNSGATPSAEQLKAQAIQLGKALNDPVAGMSALTRVGVTFTDAQKAAVKAMVESGDVMGAQKLILKELQAEFGGSAEAAGKTFAGQLQILNNQIGNVKEKIGGALIPVLADLATKYGPDVIRIVSDIGDWFATRLIPGIATAIGWLETNLPIAVQTLRSKFDEYWPAISQAVSTAWSTISEIFTAIKARIEQDVLPKVAQIRATFEEHWPAIKQAVLDAWEAIKERFILIKDWLEVKIGGAIQWLREKFEEHWPAIQAAIMNAWNVVQKPLQDFIDFLQSKIPTGATATQTALDDSVTPAFGRLQTAVGGANDTGKATITEWWEPINRIGPTVVATAQSVSRMFEELTAVVKEFNRIFGRDGGTIGELYDFDGFWQKVGNGTLNAILQKFNDFKDSVDRTTAALRSVKDFLSNITIPSWLQDLFNGRINLPGIPGYATGGYVPTTGLAMVHAGEYVIPANGNQETGGGHTFNFYGPVSDPMAVREQVLDGLSAARARGLR